MSKDKFISKRIAILLTISIFLSVFQIIGFTSKDVEAQIPEFCSPAGRILGGAVFNRRRVTNTSYAAECINSWGDAECGGGPSLNCPDGSEAWPFKETSLYGSPQNWGIVFCVVK